MYLDAKQDELAAETIEGQSYRLAAFVAWCEENEIENLGELRGRDLYAYRIWRREGNYAADEDEDPEPLAPSTLRGQLATLRAFLRFCATIDAVPAGLADDVPLPTVSDGDDVSDSTLHPARAEPILDYLGRYHYASRRHAEILLAWHTGCRISGLRALDLRDLSLEGETPTIEFVHRPDTGTSLKNGTSGERVNVISRRMASVLSDWIDGPRPRVKDEYDRHPLFTTKHGRVHKGTLRTDAYVVTRPCWYGEECPHDRDPETCEATTVRKASECPSSRSPHDFRSGRVTAYRSDNVPRRVVGDRLDASEDVLDKHYDRRNARQRAIQRQQFL
nr:tyrosine-type recombinase/integrase [Salinigranum rubrum]